MLWEHGDSPKLARAIELNSRCKNDLWLFGKGRRFRFVSSVSREACRASTHLNTHVNMVYDRPESGLCVKCRIMNGCIRGNCHAAQTAVLTAPMAQHIRFPSVVSSIG